MNPDDENPQLEEVEAIPSAEGTSAETTYEGDDLHLPTREGTGRALLRGLDASDIFARAGEADSVHYALPSVNLEVYQSQLSPYMKGLYRVESILHHGIYKNLDKDTETITELQGLVDDVASHVNLPKGAITISVYKSPFPNAGISPGEQEIRISTALLDLLEYDSNMIAGVIAHEMGHMLMRHFDRESFEVSFLDKRISGFEEEYQADRISSIILSRMGIDPSAYVDCLAKLKAHTDEIMKKHEDDYLYEKGTHDAWILYSHPHLHRRIRALKNLNRVLPASLNNHQSNKISKPREVNFSTLRLFEYSNHHDGGTPYGEKRYPWMAKANAHDEIITPSNADFNIRLKDKLVPPDDPDERYMCTNQDIELDDVTDLFEYEEVSNFSVDDRERIHEWWFSALQAPLDSDYRLDLFEQLDQLSAENLETLLFCTPTLELFLPFIEKNRLGPKSLSTQAKEEAKQSILCGDDLEDLPTTLLYITGNIFQKWFEKRIGDSRTFEDLEKVTQLVHNSRVSSGAFMPFQFIEIAQFILEVFENGDEETQSKVASHLSNNLFLLLRGNTKMSSYLFEYLLPVIKHPSFAASQRNIFSETNLALQHRTIEPLMNETLLSVPIHIQVERHPGDTIQISTRPLKRRKEEDDEEIVVSIPKKLCGAISSDTEQIILDEISKDKDFAFYNSVTRKFLAEQIAFRASKKNPDQYGYSFFTITDSLSTELALSETDKVEIELDEYGNMSICLPLTNPSLSIDLVLATLKSDPIFASFNAKVQKIIIADVTEEFPKFIAKHGKNRRKILEDLESSVPYNFRFGNKLVIGDGMVEGAESSGELERALDEDPSRTSQYLDDDEFHDKYYGKYRHEYSKVRFTSMDNNSKYHQFFDAWRRSGGLIETRRISDPIERVKFIASSFRFKCLHRDQLICRELGISEMEYAEDAKDVHAGIAKIHDKNLLLLLSSVFHNTYLRLNCAERAFEIFKTTSPQEFIEGLESEYFEKAKSLLEGVDENLATDELVCVLVCFPFCCHRRDDLIRNAISLAPDEHSTIVLSSLLTEPPPGEIRPRSDGLVSFAESSLDFMKALPSIDKEEILLYLLGHRVFYGGIIPGDVERRDGGNIDTVAANRTSALYYDGFEYFANNDGLLEEEEIEAIPSAFRPHRRADHGYLVDCPDSLILATKYAGVPLDMIFESQRQISTMREQKDLLADVLTGENGILNGPSSDLFLKKAARVITDSSFDGEADAGSRDKIANLLGEIFTHCSHDKLPELFLNCWYIKEEGVKTLPQLVAKLMQKYGPVFVKAGQYLATQSADLPPEWVKAFRSLSDENEVSEKTLLYEYEHSAYGGESPFKTLGEKIKEGSMAAVYKGKLKSGEDVAVKVRHPFIEKELEEDIALLRVIVNFINSHPEEYDIHLPENLPEVVREHMLEEVSFEKETQNTAGLTANLSPSRNGVPFFVPPVRAEVSMGNFLVMDHCPGVPLDSNEIPPENQKAYRNAVGLEILDCILAGKPYQADPNLGNFFAPAGEKIGPVGWIDRGNVRKLEGDDLASLRGIIKGIFGGDEGMITDSLYGVLDKTHAKTNGDTKDAIHEWVKIKMDGEFDVKNILNSFNEFCAQNKLLMSNEFVHLLKALGLLGPLLEDCDAADLLGVVAKYV